MNKTTKKILFNIYFVFISIVSSIAPCYIYYFLFDYVLVNRDNPNISPFMPFFFPVVLVWIILYFLFFWRLLNSKREIYIYLFLFVIIFSIIFWFTETWIVFRIVFQAKGT